MAVDGAAVAAGGADAVKTRTTIPETTSRASCCKLTQADKERSRGRQQRSNRQAQNTKRDQEDGKNKAVFDQLAQSKSDTVTSPAQRPANHISADFPDEERHQENAARNKSLCRWAIATHHFVAAPRMLCLP